MVPRRSPALGAGSGPEQMLKLTDIGGESLPDRESFPVTFFTKGSVGKSVCRNFCAEHEKCVFNGEVCADGTRRPVR